MYIEKMESCISKMVAEEGLVGLRFYASGESGPEHQERMAKAFCTLMDLEKDGLLEKASCSDF